MPHKRLAMYEINVATWLYGLRQKYGPDLDLSNIPAKEWDKLSDYGFNAVWFLGVWERSPAAIDISKANRGLLKYAKKLLPGFDADTDLIGSAFSTRSYTANPDFGGPQALAKAREELNKRGMLLLLDYIPNHTAIDHPWVSEHPEYYIQGTQKDLREQPNAYIEIDGKVFARGASPEVEPWSDIVQLNAFSEELRSASKLAIDEIAQQCDGVRCDTGVLMLNQVFLYTWREKAGTAPPTEYWSEIVEYVRRKYPNFLFFAETYWHAEQQLFDLGIDYCYDKNVFYEALDLDHTGDLFHLLFQPIDYQHRLVRFIENHDERRAATVFPPQKHKAAAVVLATTPGSRLYYEGQLEGTRTYSPVNLRRTRPEPANTEISDFYGQLIPLMRTIENDFANWHICRVVSPSHAHIESMMSWTWQGKHARYLIVVNWNKKRQRGVILPPWGIPDAHSTKLKRLLSTKSRTNAAAAQITPQGISCKLDGFQALILELSEQM